MYVRVVLDFFQDMMNSKASVLYQQNPQMKERLLSEQVKTLYWQSGLIVSFSPFMSLFLVVSQWDFSNHYWLILWFIVQCIHSFLWDQFRRNYYRDVCSKGNDEPWLKDQFVILFVMGSSAGLLYGLAVPLFFNADILESILIISLVLTGLNIAPFIGNAISFPVYLLVPIFTFGPIVVKSIWFGGYFWFLALLAIVGIVSFLMYAWRLGETFNENFRLRFENEKLAISLAEEKEQVEKASRAKTRFLAAASHDLRQPLQAQRLFAEAIRARAQDSELSELGDQIIESQRSMQSMLDALLDISRLDAGIVEPNPADVSLNDMISNLVYDFSPLFAAKGLHLHVRWPPKGTMIHCDQGLIESILRNLLSNAIRYTEKGTVMLAVRKRKEHWRLEVRDSGIGIALEQQKLIFEEFRQLGNPERDRAKGLGLGLSIVQRLCLLLDYPLTLYSRLDEGSLFAFHLPRLSDAAVLVDEKRMDENLDVLKDLDVLVVDDEQAIREGLNRALTVYGFTVRCAANRHEALRLVTERCPDVMTVDYRLPDQDTGGALIMAIWGELGRVIPAVLLTGDTAPGRLQELESIGCPVLHKPVSIQELLRAMKSVVPKT